MCVSIRKTVVAAVAAPISTPAEAQFMAAAGFMEAVSIAVAFTAEVGEAAGMAGVGGAQTGAVAGVGWDLGWAIAAAAVPVGIAIASQPAYDGGPGCWVRRRVWTASGHYIGRRLVNVCY